MSVMLGKFDLHIKRPDNPIHRFRVPSVGGGRSRGSLPWSDEAIFGAICASEALRPQTSNRAVAVNE
jgi:hypothetical protein